MSPRQGQLLVGHEGDWVEAKTTLVEERLKKASSRRNRKRGTGRYIRPTLRSREKDPGKWRPMGRATVARRKSLG